MKDIEIEIQVRVETTKKLEVFLKKNAKFMGEKYQKDEYFTPPHQDYLASRPVDEWLRIRDSEPSSINYKNWHHGPDGKSDHCDEYETTVEDIDQVRKIFAAIGVKSIAMVEKTRRIWMHNDYEIALDCITGLGDFVEIEYKGVNTSVDPRAVTRDMIKFLKKIGCGKIERNHVGYPYMILFPDEQVFEEV
jgi:adenylate cyclase class 2